MPIAVWTRLASADLEGILDYIRIHGGRPETARKLGSEILRLTDHAAKPKSARLTMKGVPDGWYYIKFKRWLIFYQNHPSGIEIVRVIDTARDLPSSL